MHSNLDIESNQVISNVWVVYPTMTHKLRPRCIDRHLRTGNSLRGEIRDECAVSMKLNAGWMVSWAWNVVSNELCADDDHEAERISADRLQTSILRKYKPSSLHVPPLFDKWDN